MAYIRSIERAFAVLEAIAASPKEIGVTEVAHQVNLPKSTVSRLLSTLERVEAVERVSKSDGFRIGTGMLALAARPASPPDLITLARPYLLELAQATGETVNLCIPDGDQAHYVDQVDSQYHLQLQDWTGYRFPMHVVSNGKLFLAHWPAEKLEQYLTIPLKQFTENTIIDPAILRQELTKILEQGYAWARGEFESEVVDLAVPIWDKDNQLVASICVGGPAFRFPPQDKTNEIIRLMVKIGRKVTERVSYSYGQQ